MDRTCCNNVCVNTNNNPLNCGACDVRCEGATPYCEGSCQPPPCGVDGGWGCGPGGGQCCGSNCCATGQICCLIEGPVSGPPTCFTPTAQEPTCPQGCAPQCASDRRLKTDIVPLDEQRVLQQLASAPFPQDPIDAHGVTLASIKALNQRLQAQQARLAQLDAPAMGPVRERLDAPAMGPVLERLAVLPLSTWRYVGESTVHVGPMAQDFHAAFGRGSTTAYAPGDAHAVSLEAIKALLIRVEDQAARIARLEAAQRSCP